jgi:hypothetical protein
MTYAGSAFLGLGVSAVFLTGNRVKNRKGAGIIKHAKN